MLAVVVRTWWAICRKCDDEKGVLSWEGKMKKLAIRQQSEYK